MQTHSPGSLPAGLRKILYTNAGVELTFKAALRAIESMKLGSGGAPDLLAISLSTHDYVGHMYGPTSPEIEKLTIEEDRAISQFLNAVKRKIPGRAATRGIRFNGRSRYSTQPGHPSQGPDGGRPSRRGGNPTKGGARPRRKIRLAR